MSLIKKLSIRKTLLASFALLVMMMFCLAWWSRLAVRDTQDALRSLRENELVLAKYITAANAALRGWGLPTVNHVVEDRPALMDSYEREMDEQYQTALQQLRALSQLPHLPPRAHGVLDRVNHLLDQASRTHANVLQLSTAGRKSEAAQLFRDQFKPALDSLEQRMGDFREVRQTQLETGVAAAEQQLAAQTTRMTWIAAGTILLTGMLVLLTLRRISRGVTDVVAAAQAVAHDVLDRDMSPVASADELDYLKNALAALRLALETSLAERAAVREQLGKLETDLAHAARVSTLGELASGLAHELTQPLAAIAGYTQACLERVSGGRSAPERLVPLLQKTASQTRRAGEIIERMRGFVRRQLEPRTALELGELVRAALTFMEHEIHRRRAQVDFSACQRPLYVWGSRVELQQVIVNLFHNALEAMEAAPLPHLTIRTFAENDDTVGVAVSDRGPGLAPGVGERIFEPFFTTRPGGLGLGLAISRSIVEAHGGRLAAEPHPDGGAVFTFTLPAHGNSHATG